MAIIKVDPSQLDFSDTQEPSSAPQSITQTIGDIAKGAGKFATGLGLSAVTGPLKLVEAADKLLGAVGPERRPNIERFGKSGMYPSEQIESLVPEEYRESEGLVGKSLQRSAGNWPFLFLGGAPTALKVGADIASSAAMTAAEKAGFGPLTQIGASILGQKGFNQAASFFKAAPKDANKIGNYIGQLYEKEKDIGSKIRVKSEPLLDKIENQISKVSNQLVDEVPGGFTSKKKATLLENMNAIRNSIIEKGQSLSASDIFNFNKDLNTIWSPKKSRYHNLLKNFQGVVKEELNTLYSQNKNWGNTAKKANELYSIQNWQTPFSDMVRELEEYIPAHYAKIVKNPLTASTIAFLSGKSPETTAAIGATVAGARGANAAVESGVRAAKFVNSLRGTNKGKKLLWEIAADSAKGNVTSLASHLNKLDKEAHKYDNENAAVTPIDPNQLEFV